MCEKGSIKLGEGGRRSEKFGFFENLFMLYDFFFFGRCFVRGNVVFFRKLFYERMIC